MPKYSLEKKRGVMQKKDILILKQILLFAAIAVVLGMIYG